MDIKLREKLNEAVEAAFSCWEKSQNRNGTVLKLARHGDNSEAVRLVGAVRWRLRREGQWGKIQTALAADVLAQMFARRVASRLQSAESEEQLALPGFEHLTKRVRADKSITVAQFLVYEAKYQARAQRNLVTAEELRRLAQMVEPFKEETGLTVATAFKRAQQSAPIVVMKPKRA